MIKIPCASCGAEGSFSLSDPSYNGPYRCWKCRALYMIKLEDNKVVSCEPLSETEFQLRFPQKKRY